jgi:ribonuclease T1
MRNRLITQFLKYCFLIVAGLLFIADVSAREAPGRDTVSIASLPVEAQQTLLLIKRGGPFPYSKDGAVFGNYEGLLPRQKRGYYREFTVKTPWVRHRGARRIVSGGELAAPREFYYTDDHYASFKQINE